MIALNLKARDAQEQTVKMHLEKMVSEVLAEKINNGVRIEKDGKTLLNKKTLATFISYAAEEAKKRITEKDRKGMQAVCVDGADIMSWAIHYFEEDSIEGILYNEDGTEYKPAKKPAQKATTPPPTLPAYTPPPPKPKPQMSIFDDLLSSPATKTAPPISESNNEETTDEPSEIVEDKTAEEEQETTELGELLVDSKTGEILSELPQIDDEEPDDLDTSAFDAEAVAILYELFEDELTLR